MKDRTRSRRKLDHVEPVSARARASGLPFPIPIPIPDSPPPIPRIRQNGVLTYRAFETQWQKLYGEVWSDIAKQASADAADILRRLYQVPNAPMRVFYLVMVRFVLSQSHPRRRELTVVNRRL